MAAAIRVITPPVEEPVSLADAKLHLRVEHDDEDAFIGSLIKAARSRIELVSWRSLVTQTLELKLDRFTSQVLLPRPPYQSIVSVHYFDRNSDEQLLDSSGFISFTGEPAVVSAVRGWPETADRLQSVRITYTAGYGDTDDVPADIKAALKLIVGHLYENREAITSGNMRELPMAVDALLMPYRFRDRRISQLFASE